MTRATAMQRGASDRREIVTPEGIPLGLKLADAGERATAFIIDLLFIFAVLLALGLVAHYGGAAGDEWIEAFLTLSAFLLVNFYFIFFEMRWRGSTPGKRLIKLRVIDARGRPLESPAIVARNLIRDLEVFIPLQVLVAPQLAWPGASGLVRLLAMGWLFIFMLMPLFNRDRLRVGDMIGGTIVVLAPKTVLLPDIGAIQGARAAQGGSYVFTDEQLDIYGIYELQVLEDVLRTTDVLDRQRTLHEVAARIKAKIGWDTSRSAKAGPAGGRPVDEERFLEDFYAAMRARLERKMLYGKRREDKYSKE